MQKIINSKIFLFTVRFIFYVFGVWVLWSWWQEVESSDCCSSNPIEGMASVMTFLYAGFIFFLMSCLLLWGGKKATAVVIVLSLLHIPLGLDRMKDPCYRSVFAGKGGGIRFESYNNRVCISEGDGLYWIYRTYKNKNINLDPKTFETIDGGFRDKNCTLYQIKNRQLECVGEPDCFYRIINRELKCIKEDDSYQEIYEEKVLK